MKKVSAIALSTAMALSMALPSKVNATSRVDQLLSNMSTRQKITQMLMVDFRYWDEDLSDGAQTTGHEFTKMNDQVRKIVKTMILEHLFILLRTSRKQNNLIT